MKKEEQRNEDKESKEKKKMAKKEEKEKSTQNGNSTVEKGEDYNNSDDWPSIESIEVKGSASYFNAKNKGKKTKEKAKKNNKEKSTQKRKVVWKSGSLQLTSTRQSRSVLGNVYRAIISMNRSIKKEPRIERLAQSHGCVRKHSEHEGSRQEKEILQRYQNVASNIACSAHGNDRNAKGWRHSQVHYNNIMRTNKVGCTAPKECPCTFCYFAKS